MPARERSPARAPRSTTPTRRSQATPRKTPSKRVSKDDEAFSPLISPSKRVRTPRTSGARRLERLELEGQDADATQQDRVVDDDEPKLGRAVRLFADEDDKGETTAAKAPTTPQKDRSAVQSVSTPSTASKQLLATPSSTIKSASVKTAYSVVKKCTGSLGGNGSGGAIYGELTSGSMQKVVNMMMEYCQLDKDSIFIDIGAGLGKPNIHVAQYPGVAASYGIEHEHVRHQLSLHNLRHLLKLAKQQADEEDQDATPEDEKVSHKIFFQYGDVYEARTLDPFTHIYMFDIGFPPKLFGHLSTIFNGSRSPWLTCYHGPKLIIDRYGFNVTLLAQTPTSMHGSSEGHMAYCYARASSPRRSLPLVPVKGDPLFADGLAMIQKKTLDEMHEWVESQLASNLNSPRPVRRRSRLFVAEA